DVEVEAAYHAEAELVGRIAEAAPMGISVSGADGSLLFANRFIMDLFGISKEDTAAGRGALKEFKLLELDGTPIPDAERPSSIALRTGRPVVGRQVRVVSPFKPETVTVSVTAVPLKAKSGAVDAVLIVHEDINERITADAEREAMAEELSRARRIEAVGNLAGGIAHDFGNVLLAISYAADALAGSASAQQPTAEHAAQLRHAIGVARQLTDSLVNYASGRDTTRRPLHLCNFLTVNCKFIARLLPHNFKVVCTPPPDPDRPVIVNASGPQLLQVLMNLAVNARDAMPMGGTLRLDLKVDRSGNAPTAVLEVSDTGQGMTPEVSRRAFERFYTT
ncbi:MAG: PAS domain-containing protein, partial [Thermoleophilia bacterium]|nr:PAS domain-containing protein [Thermoleophilia bacterium]